MYSGFTANFTCPRRTTRGGQGSPLVHWVPIGWQYDHTTDINLQIRWKLSAATVYDCGGSLPYVASNTMVTLTCPWCASALLTESLWPLTLVTVYSVPAGRFTRIP